MEHASIIHLRMHKFIRSRFTDARRLLMQWSNDHAHRHLHNTFSRSDRSVVKRIPKHQPSHSQYYLWLLAYTRTTWQNVKFMSYSIWPIICIGCHNMPLQHHERNVREPTQHWVSIVLGIKCTAKSLKLIHCLRRGGMYCPSVILEWKLLRFTLDWNESTDVRECTICIASEIHNAETARAIHTICWRNVRERTICTMQKVVRCHWSILLIEEESTSYRMERRTRQRVPSNHTQSMDRRSRNETRCMPPAPGVLQIVGYKRVLSHLLDSLRRAADCAQVQWRLAIRRHMPSVPIWWRDVRHAYHLHQTRAILAGCWVIDRVFCFNAHDDIRRCSYPTTSSFLWTSTVIRDGEGSVIVLSLHWIWCNCVDQHLIETGGIANSYHHLAVLSSLVWQRLQQ